MPTRPCDDCARSFGPHYRDCRCRIAALPSVWTHTTTKEHTTMPDTTIHLPQYPEAAIHIMPADETSSAGKLADVELYFTAGICAGLRLTGFAVWEKRSPNGRRNVTYPARTYSVNGERRSFALLRPCGIPPVVGVPTAAQDRLTALILDAYAIAERQAQTYPRGGVLATIINADAAR